MRTTNTFNTARDPNASKLQQNLRIVYSEADIQKYLTLAYQKPGAVTTIRLGADIPLTKPIVVAGTAQEFAGVIFDGAGYRLIATGPMDYMFRISNVTTLKDLRIEAANVTDIVNVVDNVRFIVNGLAVVILGAVTSVFNLGGDLDRTVIENVDVVNSGTLGSFIARGNVKSSYWTIRNIALHGVQNLMSGGFAHQYFYVTIDDLRADPGDGASLNTKTESCNFSKLKNIESVNTSSGSYNVLTELSTVNSGSFSSGTRDIVIGLYNYASITEGVGLVCLTQTPAMNTSGVRFPGNVTFINESNAAINPTERLLLGRIATSDGSAQVVASFPTETNRSYFVEADVWGRQTNGTNQVNAYKMCIKIKNNGGVLTFGVLNFVYADEEVAAWAATIDGSGTTVRVRVAGAAATNIEWGCSVRVRRV